MATPDAARRPLGGGGFAADIANVSHLLDVLDAYMRQRESSLTPDERAGGSYFEGRSDCLTAERDSARVFLDELRACAPATSPESWTDEALARLVAAMRELGELASELDPRQPGAVPGIGPETRLGVPLVELVDTTPAPRYRTPLPEDIPPPREWRCGACARAFAGYVMAGCPCGGEIELVDVIDHYHPPGEGS